ncbi:hypothetical protein DUI87_31574 [Hirundo rustica rustica]|uniref:Uncharacterized protein n=1 Tax=Hirundo rustica rustica TaxID=333673 RepID=A0A3M0ITS4_HIRRU|nr:hypothetical protein DUI87_31574 [Hirundo rustica rustica]
MGGIFGKNKRSCLFPRVVYRAKGRKAARVCCDAATWTGERHFHSARIGRTPRGFEPPAAKLVLEASGSESGGEEGFSAASPRARHSEVSAPAAAGDTRGAELSQQPEAKPHPELLKHQGLTGEAPRSPNPQESGEAGAALSPPGSSLPPELQRGVTPLTWTTVEVDVHVSADGHEEPGRGQAAAKPELLSGDTTAASCPLEEPEVPLKAAEPGEGVTNGRRAAQEQGGEESEASPDLQLGQGEVPAPEGVKGAAGEPEQAEEMAEAAGDGQTSEEIPACLPETQGEEEEIQASSEGKTGGALKEHTGAGAATTEHTEGLSGSAPPSCQGGMPKAARALKDQQSGGW